MSKRLIFLWIDDNADRKNDSTTLEKLLDVKCDFENVKDENLMNKLEEILKKSEPNLILIDHRLDNVKKEINITGSTAAEIIREKWPECPIVCITGAEAKDVDLHKKSIYEDFIEAPNLSSYYSTLISIANSFKKLKKQRPSNVDEFFKLLIPPSDEVIRLKAILPKELRDINEKDKSLLTLISKWVRNDLMNRPGFLYDRLWTATLLGVKESSFKKIESKFKRAKYKGIFADKGNERWWQSTLREILYKELPTENEQLPWILGRNLTGITKKDYSNCHVCEKDFPETVAYTDESSLKQAPMHFGCSIPHPNFNSLPFFDEIRMTKPAK